jgi:hypothetical protein
MDLEPGSSPETTEPTAIPEAGTPEPEAPAAGEQEAPATEAPDVGGALQQVTEKLSSIEERLPRGDGEGDPEDILGLFGGLDDPEDEGFEDGPVAGQGQGQEGEGQGQQSEAAALLDLVDQRASEQVQAFAAQQEAQSRTQRIVQLGEQYPEMKEPEMLGKIADSLDAAGLIPQGFPADPKHVEMAYKALKADAEASAETPAEADGQKGATLETGAGPGAPEPELHPEEKMYANLFADEKKTDVFS